MTQNWRDIPGPWDGEPDRLDWVGPGGLACGIRRNSGIENLCGYVAVPVGHPWHGDNRPDADVHGGITFSSEAGKMREPVGDPTAWVVGFDCAHSGDYCPGTAARLGRLNYFSSETYRDVDYVRRETDSLAEQAVAAAGPDALEREIAEHQATIAALTVRIEQARERIAFLRGAELAPTLSPESGRNAGGADGT